MKIKSIGKIFLEGYNTIDGHVSGLKQIRLGIVLGMWFIQFNLFIYSVKVGLMQR